MTSEHGHLLYFAVDDHSGSLVATYLRPAHEMRQTFYLARSPLKSSSGTSWVTQEHPRSGKHGDSNFDFTPPGFDEHVVGGEISLISGNTIRSM